MKVKTNARTGSAMKATKGITVKTSVKAGGFYTYSLRRFKKGIRHLSAQDVQGVHDALLGFRLATYQYKHDGAGAPTHLGFIIDEVGKSPAVDANGAMVDLYGLTSMAVAAIQFQARQIEQLERKVATLRRIEGGDPHPRPSLQSLSPKEGR